MKSTKIPIKEIMEQSRRYASTDMMRRIMAVFRIINSSWKKYIDDDAIIRANAIAYAVVISIIPILTLFVKYAEIDQETLRVNLSRFMAVYGVSEASEMFAVLNDILSRANTIAGLGSIIMIVAAANVLKQMEDSFNHIYRAEQERPLIFRFALYIAALVLMPGTMLISGGALRYYVKQLTPPRILDLHDMGNEVIMTGSPGSLRIFKDGVIKSIKLSDSVTGEAPYRTVYFDLRTGRSGRSFEILEGSALEPNDLKQISQEDFDNLKRLDVNGDNISVISSHGTLFQSTDRGRTWFYDIFVVKSDSRIRKPVLEDVRYTNDGRILVLGSIGSHSILFIKDGTHYRFKKLDSIYGEIMTLNPPSGTDPPEDVGGRREILLAGSGAIYRSVDNGRSFQGPIEKKYGNRSLRIHNIQRLENGATYYAGDNGSLWIEKDGKSSFPDIRADYNQDIHGMEISPSGAGFVYGSEHLFRYTPDGGRTWLLPENPELDGLSFNAHLRLKDGNYLFVGDDDTMLVTGQPLISSSVDTSGHQYTELPVISVHRYPRWKSWSMYGTLYTSLFILIFFLFYFSYTYFPNAYVEWKAAVIGSAITSVAFVVFIWGFRSFINLFTTTQYIYGVWMAVPLGMLVILTSTQILLFGLEVAYVIQHPHTYRRLNDADEADEAHLFWNSVMMLTLLYYYLYEENRPLSDNVLMKYFDRNSAAIRDTRKKLRKAGFIAYNASNGEYFPTRPPAEIHIKEIEDVLLNHMFHTPNSPMPETYRNQIMELQQKLKISVDKSSAKLTIKDLLIHFHNDRHHTGAKKTNKKKGFLNFNK